MSEIERAIEIVKDWHGAIENEWGDSEEHDNERDLLLKLLRAELIYDPLALRLRSAVKVRNDGILQRKPVVHVHAGRRKRAERDQLDLARKRHPMRMAVVAASAGERAAVSRPVVPTTRTRHG